MRIPLPFGLGLNPTIPSPRRCRRSATGLGPSDIDALPRKWLARLPASVHRGRSGRGRRHDLSILQAEFSLTQMLDTPISGRIFLEQVIRDNLDIGRPDQVGLVFDPRPIRRGPRATPGRFPDQGDHRRGHPEPARGRQTHHDQAVREGPAHRDHHHRHQRFRDRETTDESARAAGDRRHRQPAPARRPTNRPRPDHRGPMPCTPSPHPSPPRPAPASQACARGEQRSHALLTALPLFRLQPNGVANKDLRPLIAELRAAPPDTVTYDL